MKIKQRHKLNKESVVGTECICPSCGLSFIKEHYQQAFCKSKGGTVCKDKYWNTVTPTKRNNKTRISPASAAYMDMKKNISRNNYFKEMEDSMGYEWNDWSANDYHNK